MNESTGIPVAAFCVTAMLWFIIAFFRQTVLTHSFFYVLFIAILLGAVAAGLSFVVMKVLNR